MQKDLIFDLGMHDGSDTDFYLRKGFRVVAVEADPDFAADGAKRFAEAIGDSRLVIVNKAVASKPGKINFYRSTNSLWSTISEDNRLLATNKGAPTEQLVVEAVTSADLIREFGVPYYLKIDIEGLDLIALSGLQEIEERPKFVSIESSRRDLKAVKAELAAFAALGYDRFKVVPQHKVHFQRETEPAARGCRCRTTHQGVERPVW